MNTTNEIKESIHNVIFKSYIVFLFSVILGMISDTFFPIRIIPRSLFFIGYILIILAPFLILWAQIVSSKFKILKKQKFLEAIDFKKGPYFFMRNPTYTALTLFIIGLGIIVNSIIVVIFAFLGSLIVNFFFLKKEEKILEKKYGVSYLEYKKDVSKWI